MRKNIAAGNWKMNTTLSEGMKLASEVINIAKDEVSNDVNIILIAPFTHLSSIKNLIGQKNNVFAGAQNCHYEKSGAYTGEVSAGMLNSIGVDYVVVGHSERREYFKESYSELMDKTRSVLDNGMKPIFCFGEKLETRESGKHFELVKEQISESLFNFSETDILKIVLAYEPVWAIGTGVTASSEQAQEMHSFIRTLIAEKYGPELAQEISILYGGSVKSNNAHEIFACRDVDGGLIGGASLNARNFVDIAKSF